VGRRWVLKRSCTGDTADYKVKVLRCYVNLPSTGELAIAALRTVLSRVSDMRRGPITCETVHTRSIWKVTNAYVVTVTITQKRQSQRQLARGVVSGQHKCESCSLATALYRIKQVIGMSDLDMY
jgi:hypothetical protein